MSKRWTVCRYKNKDIRRFHAEATDFDLITYAQCLVDNININFAEIAEDSTYIYTEITVK